MTSFLSPQAQASSAAQASAALASRIDQVLSDSTLALHSQLEDLVDRAIGDLHFEHRLELELAEAECADLARELAEAKQAALGLQVELAAAHNQFEAEQRAHGQALVENAALETRLEKSVRELEALGVQQRASTAALAEAQQQVQQAQADLAGVRDLLAAEQDAHAQALADNAALEARVELGTREHEELAARLQAAAQDAEQLRQAHELQAQQASSRQQAAEEEVRQLRDALSAAQVEGEALARSLAESEQAALCAQADLQAAHSLLEAEKRVHAQSLVDNAALQTRLDKGVRELEELGARLAAAEHDAEQLRQAHESQVQDSSVHSARQQAAEAALAAAQQEARELHEQLGDTRSALAGLQGRAAQAESAAEQARQQLDRQQVCAAEALQGLQQELREQRDAQAEADASRSDLGQRLAQAGAEVEALRQHGATLTEQAVAKDRLLAELGRTLAQAGERERKSSALIGDAKGVLAESKHNIALLEVKLRDAREEANMLRAELACARLVEAEPLL
jgi:chromosome segregation ATPase